MNGFVLCRSLLLPHVVASLAHIKHFLYHFILHLVGFAEALWLGYK